MKERYRTLFGDPDEAINPIDTNSVAEYAAELLYKGILL